MTIASRFLAKFGPRAFSAGPERGMTALRWLAETDPDGTGQALEGVGIAYHFSDGSTLLYDRSTNHFTRPQ